MNRMKSFGWGLLFILCTVFGYAKEDISSIVIDYDDPVRITVAIRSTFVGNVAVKGQTKLLGAYVYNGMDRDVNMDIRWAAFQGGRVREIYDGYGYVDLGAGSAMDIKVPCLIGVPAGLYTFLPIVRFSGDSKWYMCGYAGFELEEDYMKDWKLTVLDSYDAPSCSYMANLDYDGTVDSDIILYPYQLNEKFRVQIKLKNTNTSTLKGRFKLVYERSLSKFWRGTPDSNISVFDEWKDCVSIGANVDGLQSYQDGSFSLELAPNEEKLLTVSNCHGSVYHDYGGSSCPYLTVYFLPDGKEDIEVNWLFVNENLDYCFDADGNRIGSMTHAANTQAFELLSTSVATENLDLNSVGLSYDRNTGRVLFTNVSSFSNVVVSDMSGRLVSCYRISSDGIYFDIQGSGIYVISLFDDNNLKVKSFKVLR